MSSYRKMFRAAVYAVFEKDGKVLLMRRYNTGWSDGQYTLPAGHVDNNESVIDAVVREIYEEVGLKLKKSDVELTHIMQHESDVSYFDFYFAVKNWNGVARIMEPNKCDDMKWVAFDEMGEMPVLDNVKNSLRNIKDNRLFSNYQRKD